MTAATDNRPSSEDGASVGDDRPARRRRWRLPRPLSAIALIAAVAFALGSVGSPLLGQSVYAATDELSTTSPYFDAGLGGLVVQNTYLDDTYTAQLPAESLYGRSVRDGKPAGWNPYVMAGTPLGSVPNFALWSPLSLPYYVMPTWLAPGYGKLLEVACALLGGYLFLRRLRLRVPAALLGGTVYAGSGFLDMWINFPQSRVAAFIPWVFWAGERLVQRRRITDGVLLSLPVAFMLLGGFPAVTGWALLTAGAYVLARAIAEYRDQLRRLIGVLAGAVAALFGGVALAAAQLLPFVGFYPHWLIEGRDQNASGHLGVAELATVFAPWAFGGVGWKPGVPSWYLTDANMVEAVSYLGAAAAVLVLVALALPRAGRALMPKGAWAFLVTTSAAWIVLIYFGGPLKYLQHLPVFSNNFIGRARSILLFTLAMLAAVGVELLLRGRKRLRAPAPAGTGPGVNGVVVGGAMDGVAVGGAMDGVAVGGAMDGVVVGGPDNDRHGAGPDAAGGGRPPVGVPAAPAPDPGPRWRPARARWRLVYGAAIWVAAFVAVLLIWRRSRDAAQVAEATKPSAPNAVHYGTHQFLIGFAFAGLAVLAAAVLYWSPARGRRRWSIGRFGAAALLPVLVAVQALTLVVPYAPRVDKDTFYPVTDVQSYLADNLGHDRFAGTWNAMVLGVDSLHELRALSGHDFMNKNLAAMVRGVPNDPIIFETYINFHAQRDEVDSPILDQLSARYFVTSPRDPMFGVAHTAAGDGSTMVLQPNQTYTVPVPTDGRLRAVGITPTAVYTQHDNPQSWISVVVKNATTGAVVAQNRQVTATGYLAPFPTTTDGGMPVGQPFVIPVAADNLPAGTRLTAEFTMHTQAPVTVAAAHGVPAISTVAGADDGLRLVHAGSAVIYQRLSALPRIRWASQTVVQPDEQARVDLLASGDLRSDQVVLNLPGAPADGKPATVDIGEDGADTISTTVNAQGAGYLVVADADQVGWRATVDGRSAPLVPADQGVVAVPVGAGEHTVVLHYVAPYGAAGAWISAITALVLLALAGADRWLGSRTHLVRAGKLT